MSLAESKKRSDVLQRLGGLTAGDRKWILDRLSTSARDSLVGGAAVSSNVTALPSAQADRSAATQRTLTQVLESASAGVIATVLKDEPAWIVHAVLKYRNWSWREEVKRRLSVQQRAELARLEATNGSLSSQVSDWVTDACAKRVAVAQEQPHDDTADVPHKSALEAIAAKIGTLVSRRTERRQ